MPKKCKVYDVYLDDGRDVVKVTVPAPSKRAAADICQGNGDAVQVRENPYVQDIDTACLADTLRSAAWGQAEIDTIVRALGLLGLDRASV